MEEEIILKRAMFGGYRKEEVLKYIDSILEKNEQKVELLFDQIDDLTEENNTLKSQLEDQQKNGSVESIFQENDLIHFPASLKELNEEEPLSFIKEEMDIPEGNYFVDDEKNVHILQTPNPQIHNTDKNLNKAREDKLREDKLREDKAREDKLREDKAREDKLREDKVNENEEKQKHFLQRSDKTDDKKMFASEKEVVFKEKKKEKRERKDLKTDLEIQSADSKMPNKPVEIEDDLYFIEEIRQLQDQINDLTTKLEEERKKKEELEHKLEYSSDLFVKIYKEK